MDAQEIRQLQVEGQVHALAQAWLFVAAQLEQLGAIDPPVLERAMLGTHWQGAPFEPHANQLLVHLADQLRDVREQRQRTDRYRSTGLDE